jgi:hypothetical protein
MSIRYDSADSEQVQRIYPRFADYCSNVLIFVIHHIRDVLQNMAKLDFRIDG